MSTEPGPTVAEVGEDALVAHVVAALAEVPADAPGPTRAPGPALAPVLVPAGDDAAVVAPTGPVVVSTDTLVEHHDLRREWSTPQEVGRKAVVQVLADVEAMGAVPTGLVVSLTCPGDLPLAWAVGLAAGLRQEAAAAGADVLGGDVAEGPVVVVTGTGLGVLTGGRAAVTRAGARPGDVLVLGPLPGRPLGGSAAGLDVLLAGAAQRPAPPVVAAARQVCLAAHRAPRVDHGVGAAAAAAGVHAMIDVSDGLVRDATRLAVASGVQVDLDAAALTPSEGLLALARWLADEAPGAGDDAAAQRRARRWVLTSGEEHAMLAACAPDAVPAGWRVVGRCTGSPDGSGPRVLLDGEDPTELVGSTGGWTTYAGTG